MNDNTGNDSKNDIEDLKNTSAIARAAARRAKADSAGVDEEQTGDDPAKTTTGDEPAMEEPSDGEQEEAPDSPSKKEKEGKAKKRYNKKTFILYILLGLCVVAAIVCAVGLGVELYTGRQSIKYYTELSADIVKNPRPVVTEDAAPGSPSSSERPQLPSSGNGGGASAEGPVAAEDTWVSYVDFSALSERFPDIVAWIHLEGTVLDYPVMHGTDNAYYLSHLPDKTSNRAGSVFLDYRNSPDFTDKNSLVYGHMSRVGEMFGALKNYREQEFYDAHPYIRLYTAEHDYRIVLVAGYLVDSGVETPPLTFRDDDAFLSYVSNIKRRSVFRSDVGVNVNDRLVCLCTCAYDFTNARLVIVGKLVEDTWKANTDMAATQ